MGTKWTAAQQAAIDYRGQNLLLSAAAGSGKTATLTQRIVTLLTDPHSEAEISRMLCVTFTRAAAAELRERIGKALREALANDKQNARLTRQLYDLGRAQITTIHAFCLTLLRPHAAELGLPAAFSVAQPADVKALSRQVMTDILSECYENGDEAFFRLADTLGGARNEAALDDVMLSLADKITARGLDSASFDDLASAMEKTEDFFASPLGAGTRAETTRFADHCAAYFSAMAEEFSGDEKLAKGYLAGAQACADTARDIAAACRAGSYEGVRAALAAFSPPARMSGVKKELQTDDILFFKDEYDAFKKKIAALRGKNFALSEEEILLSAARTADIGHSAAAVLRMYFAELRQRKQSRAIVDFSDLEAMAARLMTDEDGNPTDAARSAGEGYDYIFIDEYQDTNRTQDAIFTALAAGGGARFMVGDIKQSIYRFRGAEPEVFASYRRKWPPHTGDASDDVAGESIFMRENFRCDRTVVDFVNLVSRYIFAAGSIPFTADDELAYAKPQAEDYTPRPAEVCLIASEGSTQSAEAEYAAARIAGMIGQERLGDGTPVAPKHIAILLRSPGADGAAFADALRKRGIPVQNQTKRSLYEEPEAALMLSILRAIDNPARDIPLAGAMKSPVFGFSLDDLIHIRRTYPEGSLWDAVRACGEDAEGGGIAARCAAFAARLTALRADSRGMAADKLLLRLYDETDVLRLAEEDPERETSAVRANLRALYENARQYENASPGGGLYAFLRAVEEEIEQKESTDLPETVSDAVQILSIHQSKGLEFPICILARTAKKRNDRDSKTSLLFDPQIGAVMRLPDEGGVVMCDTPLRRSLLAAIDDASIEEEMRVLYVALTRARERLIVTASMADPEKLLRERALAAPYQTAHTVFSAVGFIEWILDALEAAGRQMEDISCAKIRVIFPEEESAEIRLPAEIAPPEKPADEAAAAAYESLFRERFAFAYPHAHLRGVPAKMTVSRLAPDILDEEAEAARTAMNRDPLITAMPESERNRAPRFLSGKTEFEASFAGIATHMFMQFCDFAHLAEKGAAAELDRLHTAGFLTDAHAAAVRMGEIEKFRKSALFARIRRAPVVRREFRFNAALPAWEFTADADLAEKLRADGTDVIVQGVVDCLFIEEDGTAVLLDYKTDRLTREEISNPALAAEKLIAAHGNQLRYYRAVCASMLGRKVDECLIYSLPLGGTVEVTE